jgi:hypothetical protein
MAPTPALTPRGLMLFGGLAGGGGNREGHLYDALRNVFANHRSCRLDLPLPCQAPGNSKTLCRRALASLVVARHGP